jgi:beta-galactosidase
MNHAQIGIGGSLRTLLLAAGAVGWLAAAFAAHAAEAAEARSRVEPFHRDWRFARGAHPGAEDPAFDDAAWQAVRLPHDWAIAGPYDPEANPHTGKLPWQGEGWYRKRFSLSEADRGRRVYLDFDGVMAMPVVYVNGRRAGDWDYGYMSFRVDATEFVAFGAENVVAVHVDTRPHNSRWYPGAGIYRKVQLVVAEPLHIAHWGIGITTPQVSDAAATIRIETELVNLGDAEAAPTVVTAIVDATGRLVAGPLRVGLSLAPGASATAVGTVRVPDPVRWDIDAPHLYRALISVTLEDRVLDQAETPFGVRTFRFTANEGFHLNGRRVQLNGVNLHHDLGPLGAAFHVRAMERQLEIMKDMGVNALRTSHNPPAPEVLDLCDRMGIVVWDEVFDKWDGTATRLPAVSIEDHGRKQIRQMLRRDRNHPSIVVWSVGNEVWDLEGGRYDDGPGLLRRMVGFAKEVDTTRPVTLAHAVPDSANTQLDASLDVTGWNYARRYANSREHWPELPILYSESASAYSTRGYYHLPHPETKDDYPLSLRISSYDHNSAYYSDPVDVEFALMEDDRFVAGEFVWTGFDYIGEPVPFVAEGWGSFPKRKISRAEESRISSFGIVDLVGIPKDRFYLYRSHWAPEKTTIHILPHWNWPDRVGQTVPVYVYTNGDAAELFVNGVSHGRRSKQPGAEKAIDRYRLRWEEVRYEPGEVHAVAYRDGQVLGEASVRTAGEPAALRLTPDRTALRADGEDLAYILVEAVDADGVLCPLAMHEVAFAVDGPSTIAGVGNGDHHFPHEFDADRVPLFYGKAMLILRTHEEAAAPVTVTALADGLQSAETTVRSTNAVAGLRGTP